MADWLTLLRQFVIAWLAMRDGRPLLSILFLTISAISFRCFLGWKLLVVEVDPVAAVYIGSHQSINSDYLCHVCCMLLFCCVEDVFVDGWIRFYQGIEC